MLTNNGGAGFDDIVKCREKAYYVAGLCGFSSVSEFHK